MVTLVARVTFPVRSRRMSEATTRADSATALSRLVQLLGALACCVGFLSRSLQLPSTQFEPKGNFGSQWGSSDAIWSCQSIAELPSSQAVLADIQPASRYQRRSEQVFGR